MLPGLAARKSLCKTREFECLRRRRGLPGLPGANGGLIAQLLVDVVKLCAEYTYVSLDRGTAAAAAGEDAKKALGISQACAI